MSRRLSAEERRRRAEARAEAQKRKKRRELLVDVCFAVGTVGAAFVSQAIEAEHVDADEAKKTGWFSLFAAMLLGLARKAR